MVDKIYRQISVASFAIEEFKIVIRRSYDPRKQAGKLSDKAVNMSK